MTQSAGHAVDFRIVKEQRIERVTLGLAVAFQGAARGSLTRAAFLALLLSLATGERLGRLAAGG